MLLFRFAAALTLLVVISLAGIRLERSELALKRSLSLQHYRLEQLIEERVRLRVRLHELSSPARRSAATVSEDAR
jgi:hypothetical protein